MNPDRLILSLERFGGSLPALLRPLTEEEARWRPAAGGWSVLEIVTHMADEEDEDFRTRLTITLAGDGDPWPPIDPEGWAIKRGYNEGILAEALARFADLRRRSVTWLRELNNPDWTRSHEHPKLGVIRAGDLLVSWTAHDTLHLRQIAKRLYQMVQRDGGDYSPEYAGRWRA